MPAGPDTSVSAAADLVRHGWLPAVAQQTVVDRRPDLCRALCWNQYLTEAVWRALWQAGPAAAEAEHLAGRAATDAQRRYVTEVIGDRRQRVADALGGKLRSFRGNAPIEDGEVPYPVPESTWTEQAKAALAHPDPRLPVRLSPHPYGCAFPQAWSGQPLAAGVILHERLGGSADGWEIALLLADTFDATIGDLAATALAAAVNYRSPSPMS